MNQRACHPLAAELNAQLIHTAQPVFDLLSELGRKLYFPKGILFQGAEAKARATRFNATVGIATEDGGPMYLPSIHSALAGVTPAQAYPYAPPAGRPGLRQLWRDKILEENPSLRGKKFGVPIVTSAITHGLTLLGDLFIDADDCVLMPDKLWGNYILSYGVRFGARVETFPTFAGHGFNVQALRNAAENLGRDKLIVLLNFPNNPTGYMPTPEEGDAIAAALIERARAGTRILAVCDDAYFGLFYHLGGRSMTESLFARLTNAHPNLLAAKLDGATKEFFAWGLRCGFVTFGPGDPAHAERVNTVLDAKTRGAIRAGISNSPQLSQSLVERALGSEDIERERSAKRQLLGARAARVYEVVHQPRFAEHWDVYPFNSGYFMCVQVKGVNAHALRSHLLDTRGIGVISTSESDIRIAFSCLDVDDVEPVFEALADAIAELKTA